MSDPVAATETARSGSLRQAAQVLHEVFGLERFADERYLEWFYRDNPVGPAIEITRLEGGKPVGHLAGIPQIYHRRGETLQMVFPLNIAVSPAGRGRGLMTEMSRACFDAAVDRYGDAGLIGMPNAASTPGYTGKLGFRLVRSLPARLCPPFWPGSRAVESRDVDRDYLESRAFADLVGSLDLRPGSDWSQQWTLELLRWRLSAPGAHYAVHAGPDHALVTSVARAKGVPVTVVLKVLARSRRGAVANGAAAAACRHHRTPCAVYAGFSSAARLLGAPLPDRLKPAPLNLIVRSLRPGYLDESSFEFEAMELLDFDAF